MPWTRLDDGYTDHPKIAKAGPLAAWLHTCALVYCNRLLTDGFIPDGKLRSLADVDGPVQLAQKLVDVGLWERVPDGYRVHDFHDYNMTADEVRQKREEISEKRAEAGRKGGQAKKQTSKQIASDLPSTDSSKQGSKIEAPSQSPSPTHPKPIPETPPNPPNGGRGRADGQSASLRT